MTALTTAEAGISEEAVAGHRTEYGHKAEENFENVLERLGVEPLEENLSQEDADKMVAESRVAARRTSEEEDSEEGIDFYIFNPLTGRIFPVDISVSNDIKVQQKKSEKERKEGIRFLPLSARTLELASRGGDRDLKEIRQSVSALLRSDALDQARSGEVQIPQAELAR